MCKHSCEALWSRAFKDAWEAAGDDEDRQKEIVFSLAGKPRRLDIKERKEMVSSLAEKVMRLHLNREALLRTSRRLTKSICTNISVCLYMYICPYVSIPTLRLKRPPR